MYEIQFAQCIMFGAETTYILSLEKKINIKMYLSSLYYSNRVASL